MYGCIYAVVRKDDDVCWLEPRCRCCGIDPPLTTTFCHGSNEIFNPKTALRHGQFSFRNSQVILPPRSLVVSAMSTIKFHRPFIFVISLNIPCLFLIIR